MNLKEVRLPDRYNYIAVFLTLRCNFNCSYCINSFSGRKIPNDITIPAQDWINVLNRLVSREDLPVTIQGGEPTLHPGFIEIINSLKKDLKIDILTNLSFNVEEFIDKVNPLRFKRISPYPAIRISYHPEFMDLHQLVKKAAKLHKAGFPIGIYAIEFPWEETRIQVLKKTCEGEGIIFKTKEFLGKYHGNIFGTYIYPEAVRREKREKCKCRTSELIIGPSGDVFRCHHDLYSNFNSIGNLNEQDFAIQDIFRECDEFGYCNPCDLKIKTNRFQIFGHSSVEIKNIGKPPKDVLSRSIDLDSARI